DVPIVDTGAAAPHAPDVDELGEMADGSDPAADDDAGDEAARRAAATEAARSAPSTVAANIDALRKKGFARLLVDDRAVAFDDIDPKLLTDRSMLQVVVDRVQVGAED